LLLFICLGLAQLASTRAAGTDHAVTFTYLPLIIRPMTYDEPVGLYDETFGVNGWVSTGFPSEGNDVARALALQDDGKVLAAGYAFNGSDYDFALARYLPDGSLDASFDGDGWMVIDFGGNEEARAIALQTDGKIILAGYTDLQDSFDFALARLLPDGSLDNSFNSDGLLSSDLSGANDSAFALALQPDGALLIAGYIYLDSASDFALARYLPDGNLDASFDGDGWASLDFAGQGDQAFAMALQADGRVVLAGVAEVGMDSADFALARFNPDGSLDASFDGDGWLLSDFDSTYDSATAVLVQPDGRIVAAGDSSGDMAVARYQADGVPDPAFDEDGLLRLDFYTLDDSGNAVILQPDGKLILAGSSHFCHETDFALARLTPDGNLDRSFEDDGQLLSYIVEVSEYGMAVLQQPDGRLVVAGTIDLGNGDDFLLARFK
jgi:uncharacterized delta-60 repeat protein